MKYCIFGDIHSNLESLTVLMDYCKSQNITDFICCGDIVGYGPSPVECIEKLFSLPGIRFVMGNHDAGVCGKLELSWFNDKARESLLYTKSVVNLEQVELLVSLPEKLAVNNFIVVHGSPRMFLKEYLIAEKNIKENIDYFNSQICFVGHTHIPFVFTEEKNKKSRLDGISGNSAVILEPGNRYIINIGSVGQPRDNDPKLCFVIYDTDRGLINFMRLKYNIIQTQQKMKLLNFSQFNIDRLESGV